MDMVEDLRCKARKEFGARAEVELLGARTLAWTIVVVGLSLLASCTAPQDQIAAQGLGQHDILVRHGDSLAEGAPGQTRAQLHGATVSGVIEVSIGSRARIHEVTYTLDRTQEIGVATEPPFVVTLDTTALSDGPHLLSAVVGRANGAASKAISVVFDVANHGSSPDGDGEPNEGGGGSGEDDEGGEPGEDSDPGVGDDEDEGDPEEDGDEGEGADDGEAEQPANEPPTIRIASESQVELGESLDLEAIVSDDGNPTGNLTVAWSKVTGPGTVSFGNAHAMRTYATFSATGSFVIRATVSDGELSAEAAISVAVTEPPVGGDDPEIPEPSDPDDPLDGEFDGPIRITKGGVYSGRWASTDPKVPAVLIDTTEPVVIENSVLRGPGHLISTEFHKTTRLTVRNTYGFGERPNTQGRAPGRFVAVETFAELVVENNYLEGTSGIYAHRWVGGGTVKVRYNRARNVVGLWSDGKGGWLTGSSQFSIVQFVQFNDVKGIKDVEIAWNEVINVAGESRTEDVISMYRSGGTTASPIRIHNNYIQGSYPAEVGSQAFSGGGIMLGDHGGSNQVAYRNHVVSVSNYGIAIAGGSNNRIEENRVVSAGVLEDGTRIHAANVGIYIWDQYSDPFENNVGTNNIVGYVQIKSDGKSVRNDWWVPDASSWSGNTKMSGSISLATERAEYERWVSKYTGAGILIGVN